jgi:hypothetical protein
LAFFAKYKNLETEASLDRDVLVVYFHIANLLFKRLSSRFYIPLQEMIALTKEIFEGDHITEFSSVDRMDIINLAGIHKYNAVSVFNRVTHPPFRSTNELNCKRPNWGHANSHSSKKMSCCMPTRKLCLLGRSRKIAGRLRRMIGGPSSNVDVVSCYYAIFWEDWVEGLQQ